MKSDKRTDKGEITIRSGELIIENENLLRVTFFEDAEIEVEDIKELFEKALQITHGKPYYLLTDARKFLTASKEAREYAARNLRNNQVRANAILSNSIPVILIINFYIRIHRPEVPTQMFKHEGHAISWLQSQMKKEKL